MTTIWWLQGPDWAVPTAALNKAVAGQAAPSDGSANPIVRPLTAVVPADATRWFPLLVAVGHVLGRYRKYANAPAPIRGTGRREEPRTDAVSAT